MAGCYLVPEILFQIADRKYKPIENVEEELQRWRFDMVKVLTLYGANDKQIGYSKGLEYLVMGLLVTIVHNGVGGKFENGQGEKEQSQIIDIEKQELQQLDQQKQPNGGCFLHSQRESLVKADNEQPSLSNPKYFSPLLQTHFKYLLFTKQLRNMYFPGTPKLYPQIQSLAQQMRSQTPSIYSMLEEMKIEFVKLFINYYKTFLLYKVRNPEVIRKVMELLVVYGVDLVRIVVIRILARQEKKIMAMKNDEETVLKYIAERLVEDYFGMAQAQEVMVKAKRLFVLDTLP